MSKTCRDIAKHLPDGCPSMLVLPLYASLPYAQQLRVFQRAPKVSAPCLLPSPIPGYPDRCTSGTCAPVSRLQIRCVDRVPRYLSHELERRKHVMQGCRHGSSMVGTGRHGDEGETQAEAGSSLSDSPSVHSKQARVHRKFPGTPAVPGAAPTPDTHCPSSSQEPQGRSPFQFRNPEAPRGEVIVVHGAQ